MRFSTPSVLSVVATALVASQGVTASPAPVEARSIEARSLSAASTVLAGVSCPTGFDTWSHESSGYVANHSPYEVWTQMGDFFNTTWQDYALTKTTGTDNTIGAVRYFSLLGLSLSEKLNVQIGSLATWWFPAILAKYQTIFVQQFNLQGSPVALGVQVTKTNDYLTVYKSASGGTQITWFVGGCSNGTATAEAIFTSVHDPAVAGIVAYFA